MPHIGRLVNVGLAVEATRGAGKAATHWMPKVSFTHQDRKENAISQAETGGIWMEGHDAYVVNKFGQGDLEAELSANSFGNIMYATLGACSTAGPTDSAYTHTFSLDEDSNEHKSLAISVNDPVQDKMFKMAMLETLTINVTLTDIVGFTASFMSLPSADSSHTPSYVKDYKFTHKYFTLKLATNTAGLAAATPVSVTEFSMTFEKNTELDNILGSVQPDDIHNKGFSIKGEFTIKTDNETYKDYAFDATMRALRFELTNTDEVIGSGTNPSFRIDLSRVFLESWEIDRPNDDIVTEKIGFIALVDPTNGNMINDCYIVNDTVSY